MSPALPLFVSSIFSLCLIIEFISLCTCLSNLSHIKSCVIWCSSRAASHPSVLAHQTINTFFLSLKVGCGCRHPHPPPPPPEIAVRAMRVKNLLRNWARLFDMEEIELYGVSWGEEVVADRKRSKNHLSAQPRGGTPPWGAREVNRELVGPDPWRRS